MQTGKKMDITRLISELKTEFELNDKQVDALTSFYNFINKSYESELFHYSIKKCVEDCYKDTLFAEMAYCASGFFRDNNIPYFCVHELISIFASEIFQKAFNDRKAKE